MTGRCTMQSVDPRPFFIERGSAVRVRQRALQKRRKSALFLWHWFARAPVCSGYGAVYGAFRFRTPLSLVADAVSIGRIGSASAVWDAACKGRSGENEYRVEAGEVPAVKPRRLKWQEVVGRLGGPEEPPRAFCATGEAAARRGSPPVLPSRSVRLSGGAGGKGATRRGLVVHGQPVVVAAVTLSACVLVR
jgi:hypothetical protein